jgi:tetratricopeptide (TPR) repeat protein
LYLRTRKPAEAGKADEANKAREAEAIDDFTEALRVNPKFADAYSSRGAIFLEQGLLELAIDDLTEAISLAPESHEAICQRARAWLTAGKTTEAIEDARLAIRLDPKRGDAFRTMGSAFLSSPNQRPDRAVEYFERAIHLNKSLAAQINPELAQAHFKCAVSLDKAGKQTEADNAFREAEKLDKKYVDRHREYDAEARIANIVPGSQTTRRPTLMALYQQASLSLEQKQFAKALGDFSEILTEDPTWADAWCMRGSVFLEKGFPDSAIKDFDRAILLAPDLADAYRQRGRAYTEMGDCSRAIQDTTKAIRFRPDFALAYFHRAIAYLAESNLDRALADLDEAVDLANTGLNLNPELKAQAQPVYFEIYRSQGEHHLAAQRWDKAIVSFEKAIDCDKNMAEQLGPQLAHAYRERGFNHARRSEFDEAVRNLKKAFELDKDNAQNHRLCGLTCCKMAKACHDRGATTDEKQQWDAAVHHLERAKWLAPEIEHLVRHPLADAQHNLDAISPPAKVTQHTGL